MELNVKTLIQELVDANVGPEDFCKKLENLLNAAPQPCLVGFLKVTFVEWRKKIERILLTICLEIPEKSSATPAVAGNQGDRHRRHQSTESERGVLKHFSTNSSKNLKYH